ncbi:signal peptidase I [Williamsia muralis]|uniref:signal peptidase I n=1 Tax=Williamsia marianensis TaxID=85044 RepID=UPI0038011E28
MATRHSAARRHTRILPEVALTVGAVAGLMCIIAAVLALTLGIRPLIVRSGSMEPAMPVGSLVLAKEVDASALDSGDIVSVKRADGSLLTHRLVAIDSLTQGTATFRMKGDANASEDPAPYVTSSADRVFFTIPAAGYAVSWLGTPPAWGLIALTSAGLLFLAFRPQRDGDHHNPASSGHSRNGSGRVGTAAASLVIATTVVTAGVQIADTTALFADTATTTSTFTTALYGNFAVVPSNLNCVDDQAAPRTARLYWTAAPSGYYYRIDIFSGITYVGSHVIPEGTTSYHPTAGAAPAPGTGTRTYTARLHTVYGVTGSTSTAYSTHNFTSTYVNFLTTIQCAAGQTAARMAAPATTSSSTSTAPPATTTTAPTTTPPTTATTTPPATTTTTTTTAPPATTTTAPPATTTMTPPPTTALPAGGVTSPSGAYTAYADTSNLTIRNSGASVVYTDTIVAGSNPHWQSGTDTLWVIHNGQADKVSETGGVWSTTAVPNADLPPEIAALV